MTLSPALLTLIGVVVGACLSWGAATLTERSRFERQQRVHWRNQRLAAYASFAAATKSYMSTFFRVGASLTIDDQTEALSLSEATPLLAKAFQDREEAFEKIRLVGADQVAEAARAWVRGIYDMRDTLSIIALQREDVVLPGDLALRKAVQAAYQLDHLPTQQEVLAIAEKWRPYRSLATSYLFSAAFEPT
jgi:hypothetical protein